VTINPIDAKKSIQASTKRKQCWNDTGCRFQDILFKRKTA